MITYQRSKSWQMAAVGLAIAVAGGATYWWFGQKDGDNRDGVVLADHKGAPSGWLQPGVGNEDPVAAL